MAENGINAGVTLMQEFCRPESDVFCNYLDYLDREEAKRDHAIHKFNLFNEYMGNPEKSTGLFTADKDSLTLEEKREIKSVFEVAQANESLMWQTVISFDNRWLDKNGIYDMGNKVLDERKLKEVTRIAISRLLKSEGLEHAIWSAGIHYNTDNIHVHIAIVEPYPVRGKMLYRGSWEVRGKFKKSNIDKCKSAVVNEIMQTREMNLRINNIIRKDIVQYMKSRELVSDPVMKEKFLGLCEKVPDLPGNVMHYNNKAMGPYRGYIDEISRLFLDNYIPEKYEELLELLEHQGRLYEEAYGGNNYGFYKEDKLYDLMQRMGNAVLKSAKDYRDGIKQKIEVFEKGEARSEYIPKTQETWKEEMEWGDTQPEWDLGLKRDSDKSEVPPEFLEAEQYFENLYSAQTSNQISIPISDSDAEIFSDGYGMTYGSYFSRFRELRKELKGYLKAEHPDNVKIADFLKRLEQESERGNPFVKHLLGEMYLYGQICETDIEESHKLFAESLEIFEEDLESGMFDGDEDLYEDMEGDENEKFSFKSYVEYRIGKQYDRGWGTEVNKGEAARCFSRSGASYATYALGNLLYTGQGVEQDYETAFKLFSSVNDNPFADLKRAEMYREGRGTEVDMEASERAYKTAFKKFLKAEMDEEDALFEYQLGRLMYLGKGCEQDTSKAVQYLEKAVKQKNIPTMLLLSDIYIEQSNEEGMSEIITELEKLSDKGENQNAQYTLGRVYTADWKFYDLQKGVSEYKKAALQGHEYAKYQLGRLYTNPDLEIFDLRKGVEYFEQAKDQGNEYAKYSLGKLYLDRDQEVYDIVKGVQYLQELVEAGNQSAKYTLGVEFLNSHSEAYNPSMGIKYMEELSEDGNEYAQIKMGIEYIKGEHVEKNYEKAREYFQYAADQGNEYAREMLSNLTPFHLEGGTIRKKLDPLGELDKAMIALRKSLYEAQQESKNNILLYEELLQEELEMQSM